MRRRRLQKYGTELEWHHDVSTESRRRQHLPTCALGEASVAFQAVHRRQGVDSVKAQPALLKQAWPDQLMLDRRRIQRQEGGLTQPVPDGPRPRVLSNEALDAFQVRSQADQPGMYRFEAEARLGEELLGSARLAVRRADGVAEHFRIQQNRALLESLAGVTGGRYFALDDLDALPETIQFSDAGILETEILDLWNMPIVFLLLLMLKTGEWLLRLFWGRL